MKYANLERFETSDQGTFGRILFDDKELFTGELPDRNNRPNLSCIPTGLYVCKWTYSPAFKRMMYLVTRVEGRSGIRIHSANLMGAKDKGYKSHLYGCIAMGERLGHLGKQKAILVSRPAISAFERWANTETFELEIIDGISR